MTNEMHQFFVENCACAHKIGVQSLASLLTRSPSLVARDDFGVMKQGRNMSSKKTANSLISNT